MSRLRGNNQIKKFKQVAQKLVSEISQLDGVCSIVFLGGLTRGFADKFSDVDLIVFLNKNDNQLKRQIRTIGSREEQSSGLDIDLGIRFFDNFKKLKWHEVDMWDFSHAEVAFDPQGKLADLLGKKLTVPQRFWLERIAEYAEYLKWYCCPPEENVGTVAEAWIHRGDLASAHFCLNYAVDLIVRMMFALNREFLPAPKWMLFYSHGLKWLPTGYKKLLEEALTIKSLSETDFKRRTIAVRKLWAHMIPKIEHETGHSLHALSKYYLKTVLHETV